MSSYKEITELIKKGDFLKANSVVYDLTFIESNNTKIMFNPTIINEEIIVDGELRIEDNGVLFLEK